MNDSNKILSAEQKQIMELFDKIFDEYLDKKISKVYMLKCCKSLYRKLMLCVEKKEE